MSKAEVTFKEKRKHERVPYNVSVELQSADGEKFAAKMQNMSRGGAFVEVSSVLDFNSRVSLIINLPRVDDLCEIPCVVRWVKEGSGVGLQFEHLRAIELWAINHLLKEINDSSG